MAKIVVIASTGGSVLSKTLLFPEVRDMINLVVSDRHCGAIDVAEKNGIPTMILVSNSGKQFSERVSDYFTEDDDLFFVSFYTRLLTNPLLSKFQNKIVNCHPSILPACPGMDGFGDTIKSGSKFIGATIHFVDQGIDTGQPLIQSSFPFQPNLGLDLNRHRVFIQQCKMFIQFVEWVRQDRIKNKKVLHANYNFSEFAPNLDSEIALKFGEND